MAAWRPAALQEFVKEVVKTLRELCYCEESVEGFAACRDQFFYRTKYGMWSARQLTDAQALTLIKTHVRALVGDAAGAREAQYSEEVRGWLGTLRALVSRADGEDKVQAMLDELAKHGEFAEYAELGFG